MGVKLLTPKSGGIRNGFEHTPRFWFRAENDLLTALCGVLLSGGKLPPGGGDGCQIAWLGMGQPESARIGAGYGADGDDFLPWAQQR